MKGKRLYVLTGTFAMAGVVALAVVLGFLLGNSNDDAGIDGRTAVTESTTDQSLGTASARNALSGGVSDAGGTSVGIQVHGRWTIEVRNPDGTLASRNEFDNALVPGGEEALARLLARENSTGVWQIKLNPSSNPLGACLAGVNPEPCRISEADLTVSRLGGTVTIAGNVIALRDGDIAQVETLLKLCPSSNSPDTCVASSPGATELFITSTNITPVSVVTGQQILATVELSFS